MKADDQLFVVGFCTPLIIEEVPVCLTDVTRLVSKHPPFYERLCLHFGVHYIEY